MIPSVVNIDKNSPILGLDRSCHSNGTITVYVGGFILDRILNRTATTLRVRLAYNHTRDRRVIYLYTILVDKKMVSND